MNLKISFLEIFLLSLILLAGFGVRFYKIDNPVADWHSWRQADTASVTKIYLEKGLDLLHPRYHDLSNLQTGYHNLEGWRFVEFPIFNTLHYYLYKAQPSLGIDKSGRLVSVFASLVSIVLIFFVGKRFLGNWGGVLAAFLFAFMPFNIYYSRVVLPEPLAVTFILATLVTFVRWFDDRGKIWLYISAFLFALALLVKPYMVFYGLAMLYLILVKYDWNFRKVLTDGNLWLFASIALLPLVGWRIWMTKFPEGIPFYKWTFNHAGIRFKPSFWYWIFGERLGKLMLGIWGLFPFLAGILTANRKELQFPLALGASAFAYVSVIAAANVRHDYYQALTVPAVVLILTQGVLWLFNTKIFAQPLAKILTAVCVVWGLYFSWLYVRDYYQVNHYEIIEAGQAVDKIAPKDALVVAPFNGDTAFLYQTGRSGWPYQNVPVEKLVEWGADYYVSVNLNDEMTQDAMRKFEIPVQTEKYVIIDLNKKRIPNS